MVPNNLNDPPHFYTKSTQTRSPFYFVCACYWVYCFSYFYWINGAKTKLLGSFLFVLFPSTGLLLRSYTQYASRISNWVDAATLLFKKLYNPLHSGHMLRCPVCFIWGLAPPQWIHYLQASTLFCSTRRAKRIYILNNFKMVRKRPFLNKKWSINSHSTDRGKAPCFNWFLGKVIHKICELVFQKKNGKKQTPCRIKVEQPTRY